MPQPMKLTNIPRLFKPVNNEVRAIQIMGKFLGW